MRPALPALVLACLLAVPLAGATRWKPTSPSLELLTDVLFADAQDGLAVGNGLTILRTTDGGVTWEEVMGDFLSTWWDAAWGAPGEAWVAGANTIFQPLAGHSTDGGRTWTLRSFYIDNNEAALRGIATRGSEALAAARIWDGQGAVARSTDGGATWTTALFVPEALLGIDAHGSNVVAAGDHATYASHDSGATWMRADAPASLESVDLLSPLDAIAVGEAGTILRSSDGGLTWGQVASGTSADLHRVRFTGSVGHAVGAAGTLLASSDGGASWQAEDPGTTADLWGVDAQPDAAPFGRGWYAGQGVLGMGWDLPSEAPRQLPVSR